MSFIFLPTIKSVGVRSAINTPERPRASMHSGNGSVTGVVRQAGSPVSRRVNLHTRPKGELVASTWSDSQGNYKFRGLSRQHKYYMVSLDEDRSDKQFPALVQDLISGDYDDL